MLLRLLGCRPSTDRPAGRSLGRCDSAQVTGELCSRCATPCGSFRGARRRSATRSMAQGCVTVTQGAAHHRPTWQWQEYGESVSRAASRETSASCIRGASGAGVSIGRSWLYGSQLEYQHQFLGSALEAACRNRRCARANVSRNSGTPAIDSRGRAGTHGSRAPQGDCHLDGCILVVE